MQSRAWAPPPAVVWPATEGVLLPSESQKARQRPSPPSPPRITHADPCSRQARCPWRACPLHWPGQRAGSERMLSIGCIPPFPDPCRNCASTCPTLPTSAPVRTTLRTCLSSSSWTTCTMSAPWARSSMGCSAARTTDGKGRLWALVLGERPQGRCAAQSCPHARLGSAWGAGSSQPAAWTDPAGPSGAGLASQSPLLSSMCPTALT